MTKSATTIEKTTNDARELNDAMLEAVAGGWRPHRVYNPGPRRGSAAVGGIPAENTN